MRYRGKGARDDDDDDDADDDDDDDADEDDDDDGDDSDDERSTGICCRAVTEPRSIKSRRQSLLQSFASTSALCCNSNLINIALLMRKAVLSG